MTDPSSPTLPLIPTDEERQIRETVAKICSDFGPKYTRTKIQNEEPPTELWDALASRGYLGVNVPEEYGGSGLGMGALAGGGGGVPGDGGGLLLVGVSPRVGGGLPPGTGPPHQKRP